MGQQNTTHPPRARPSTPPLVNVTSPVLQWPTEPQSAKTYLEQGRRYWFELLCSRSSEYTGYGTPEADLAAATGGQDGYRMGRCDVGVRVHAPSSGLPSGAVKGAAFETQQLVLLTSEVGFVEVGFANCDDWIMINQSATSHGRPRSARSRRRCGSCCRARRMSRDADDPLEPRAPLQCDVYERGHPGRLRARSYGIEWRGRVATPGGVDVLPISGDMLVAPSLRRRPCVSVRRQPDDGDVRRGRRGRRARWAASCGGSRASTTSYDNPDDVLELNATVESIGGMTLERCSMHCEARNYSYFAVSQLSGITQECGCLAAVDTDDVDAFEPVPTERCDAECTSDAGQLCGGRSVSLGERYSSVYATEDRTRSLHYQYEGATAEPQLPCRLDFWMPSVRVTGVFPSSAAAGEPVFVLVQGLAPSLIGTSTLTVCGHQCLESDYTPQARAAILANFSIGSWSADIPLGIYDATPLVCKMPACEAGKAEALLYVAGAGFAQPGQLESRLEVESVTRPSTDPLTVALASDDVEAIGTPGGGVELEIVGKGFSSDVDGSRHALLG